MEVIFTLIFAVVFLSTVSLMVFSSLFQVTYKDTTWTNKRAMKLICISVLRALMAIVSFVLLFLVFFGLMLFVGMYIVGEIENDYTRYTIGLIALMFEIFAIYMGFKKLPNSILDDVDKRMKDWVKR